MNIIRDIAETKSSISASDILSSIMSYNVVSPECDNVKILESYYFTKCFYISEILTDNGKLVYENRISSISPYFSNGYDCSV